MTLIATTKALMTVNVEPARATTLNLPVEIYSTTRLGLNIDS